jgi:hypothetical protein
MEKKHIRKGSGWYEVEQAEKQLKSKKVLARRTTIEKPLMYSEYDLPKHEIDNLKERFLFFDRNKTGYIYRYQLPMLLKCKITYYYIHFLFFYFLFSLVISVLYRLWL